jgi:hypothetical protein
VGIRPKCETIEGFAVFHALSIGVLRVVKWPKGSRPSAYPPSLLTLGNPDVGTEFVKDLQDKKSGGRFDPLPEGEAELKTLT